jgi:hypothetical protein
MQDVAISYPGDAVNSTYKYALVHKKIMIYCPHRVRTASAIKNPALETNPTLRLGNNHPQPGRNIGGWFAESFPWRSQAH